MHVNLLLAFAHEQLNKTVTKCLKILNHADFHIFMIFDLKHLVLKCFSRNVWSSLFFLSRFCCLCRLLQSCGQFTQFRLYISPMLFNIASGSIQGLRFRRWHILCFVLLLFFLWLSNYLFITARISWRSKSCRRFLVFILGHHDLPGLKVGQEIIINWLTSFVQMQFLSNNFGQMEISMNLIVRMNVS